MRTQGRCDDRSFSPPVAATRKKRSSWQPKRGLAGRTTPAPSACGRGGAGLALSRPLPVLHAPGSVMAMEEFVGAARPAGGDDQIGRMGGLMDWNDLLLKDLPGMPVGKRGAGPGNDREEIRPLPTWRLPTRWAA
jgi:hypothetical protein